MAASRSPRSRIPAAPGILAALLALLAAALPAPGIATKEMSSTASRVCRPVAPVLPTDPINEASAEILRDGILLTCEAEAEGITTDDFIQRLLEMVAIP